MAGKSDSNKRRGSIYEMEFLTRALKNGLEVFTPIGDYLPQDCLVLNEHGRVYKVQVKGTAKKADEYNNRKHPRYRLSTGTGRNGRSLINCEKVDIIAGYIEPIDTFYLIPCSEIKSVTTCVYSDNPDTTSHLEKYRENWTVFKEVL